MHSIFTRGNAIFAFALSNLAVLTGILVLSTIMTDYSSLPDVKISISKKTVKNLPDYSANREMNDLGILSFNLDADFEKVFNWNTKQLFLYMTAEYQTKNNVLSQIVLWDHIMLRSDKSYKLKIREKNTKYYFWDDGNGLVGNQNITLTLNMSVIPNSGLLVLHNVPKSIYQFSMPASYAQTR